MKAHTRRKYSHTHRILHTHTRIHTLSCLSCRTNVVMCIFCFCAVPVDRVVSVCRCTVLVHLFDLRWGFRRQDRDLRVAREFFKAECARLDSLAPFVQPQAGVGTLVEFQGFSEAKHGPAEARSRPRVGGLIVCALDSARPRSSVVCGLVHWPASLCHRIALLRVHTNVHTTHTKCKLNPVPSFFLGTSNQEVHMGFE